MAEYVADIRIVFSNASRNPVDLTDELVDKMLNIANEMQASSYTVRVDEMTMV